MSSTEPNTIEQMIFHAAAKLGGKPLSMVCPEDAPPYGTEPFGDELRPARWTYALTLMSRASLLVPVSCTGDFREGIENAAQQNCYREPTR